MINHKLAHSTTNYSTTYHELARSTTYYSTTHHELGRYAAFTGGAAPSHAELAKIAGAKPLRRNADFIRKSREALQV